MLAVLIPYLIHAFKYFPEFIYLKHFTKQVQLKIALGFQLKKANSGGPVFKNRIEYLLKYWPNDPNYFIGKSAVLCST